MELIDLVNHIGILLVCSAIAIIFISIKRAAEDDCNSPIKPMAKTTLILFIAFEFGYWGMYLTSLT